MDDTSSICSILCETTFDVQLLLIFEAVDHIIEPKGQQHEGGFRTKDILFLPVDI